MTTNTRFFTSLQAMIVLLIFAIFGIMVLLAWLNSKTKASDAKRMGDVSVIQEALKADFDVNGFYPASRDSKPEGIETYLDFWPAAPKVSGSCTTSQNTYVYSPQSNGEDYSLTFCLGKKYENLDAGMHTATSKGIQ